MKPAWPLALGAVAAAAAATWWLLLRQDDAARPSTPKAGTASTAPRADGGATTPPRDVGTTTAATPPTDAAGAAISPPPEPPPEAPPTDSVPFEREARDPAWAVDQERELRVRMDHVAELLKARSAEVAITAAECRTSLCRLSIDARADKDLSALYGALETTDGLLGWADGIVLGELARDPQTERITTTVTVAFDR